MIKVILVENHQVLRSGLKMLLESAEDIQVVLETGSTNIVFEKIKEGLAANILVTDLSSTDNRGVEVIQKIKEFAPNLFIIVFSMSENEQDIFNAFDAGASAYVCKSILSEELFFAIRQVLLGNQYLCSLLAIKLMEKVKAQKNMVPKDINDYAFSSREIEILRLIADGMTNCEMADKLFISKRTVEGHRQNLIDKTKAKNTAALMRFAFTRGFIQ